MNIMHYMKPCSGCKTMHDPDDLWEYAGRYWCDSCAQKMGLLGRALAVLALVPLVYPVVYLVVGALLVSMGGKL